MSAPAELGALARIGQYVGMPREFDSFEQAVAAMRADSLPFGPHSDEQWAQLARYVYPEQDGRWVKHYDLALAQPLAAQTPQELAAGEQLLWQCYVGTDCPVLIVRGEQSDLLTTVTVDEMLQRNPRARAVVMPGVGHAPTLMSDAQIEPVAAFLLD